MLSFLAILLLTTFVLLWAYLYNTYTYWKRKGIAYEKPVPPFGNFKGIGKEYHIRDIIQRLYYKFKHSGPFSGCYMFFTKTAIITDLDLIKTILIKEFSNFHDRGLFSNPKDDPLTGQLVNLEGDEWKAMRSKLTPVFTSARMKYMFPTMVKVGENFATVMGDKVMEAPDHIVELKDLCARFTTDVIGTCAFGIECNSLKDPQAEFRQKGRLIMTKPRHNALLHTFLVTNPGLAKKFGMKHYSDDVTEFFVSVVRQTVEYRLKNSVKGNDFMDLLIELKANDDQLAKSSDGINLTHGLTIEQMAAQTFVFFIGGFETSSTTIALCLYELARHMDVQEKLRKEILKNLSESKDMFSYENLHQMTYLEQVICETLRLYPIIPNLMRTTKTDYHVPGTKCVIEKDVRTIIPIHAIHNDAEYYDSPREFKPERFEPAECEKRHSCAYLPFGDGPRSCIGMRFGLMQTKIGLVSLLREYRFECCHMTQIPMEFDKKIFTFSPQNGVFLKVIKL